MSDFRKDWFSLVDGEHEEVVRQWEQGVIKNQLYVLHPDRIKGEGKQYCENLVRKTMQCSLGVTLAVMTRLFPRNSSSDSQQPQSDSPKQPQQPMPQRRIQKKIDVPTKEDQYLEEKVECFEVCLNWELKSGKVDLDASCVLLDYHGMLVDAVHYNQLKLKGVRHSGDMTGEGKESFDERIWVSPSQLSEEVSALFFGMSSIITLSPHKSVVNCAKENSFNDVKSAKVHVFDTTKFPERRPLIETNISCEGKHTGFLFCLFYRRPDGRGWNFRELAKPCMGRTFLEVEKDMKKALRFLIPAEVQSAFEWKRKGQKEFDMLKKEHRIIATAADVDTCSDIVVRMGLYWDSWCDLDCHVYAISVDGKVKGYINSKMWRADRGPTNTPVRKVNWSMKINVDCQNSDRSGLFWKASVFGYADTKNLEEATVTLSNAPLDVVTYIFAVSVEKIGDSVAGMSFENVRGAYANVGVVKDRKKGEKRKNKDKWDELVKLPLGSEFPDSTMVVVGSLMRVHGEKEWSFRAIGEERDRKATKESILDYVDLSMLQMRDPRSYVNNYKNLLAALYAELEKVPQSIVEWEDHYAYKIKVKMQWPKKKNMYFRMGSDTDFSGWGDEPSTSIIVKNKFNHTFRTKRYQFVFDHSKVIFKFYSYNKWLAKESLGQLEMNHAEGVELSKKKNGVKVGKGRVYFVKFERQKQTITNPTYSSVKDRIEAMEMKIESVEKVYPDFLGGE